MTARIKPVDPNTVAGEAKAALEEAKSRFGATPMLTRVLAQSPAG